MPTSGSILGNAVRRLEDPTLLDRRREVRRRPRRAGHAARRVRALARSRTPTWARSTSPRRRRCRASSRVYHAAGDDLGLAVVAAVRDDARHAEPAGVRHRQGALRRRHRRGRRRRDVARRPSTPPRRSSSTTTRCPRSSTAPDALAPDAPLLVPGARVERVLRHHLPGGRRRRPARRRRRRRRSHDGEPAARRRADGDQRHPRGARATAASRCWVSHQAPHAIHAEYAADARPRTGAAARRVPVGRRRLRSQGRGRTSSTSSRRPRPLKLGRPVKWIATRSEDMVSLVQGRDFVMTAKLGVDADGKIVGLDAFGCRRGRRVPGDRRDPADAHADDVGRRLRDPQGAVQGRRRR